MHRKIYIYIYISRAPVLIVDADVLHSYIYIFYIYVYILHIIYIYIYMFFHTITFIASRSAPYAPPGWLRQEEAEISGAGRERLRHRAQQHLWVKWARTHSRRGCCPTWPSCCPWCPANRWELSSISDWSASRLLQFKAAAFTASGIPRTLPQNPPDLVSSSSLLASDEGVGEPI